MKPSIIFASAVVLALTSCGPDPMKVETSPNGANAYLIATVDGCRLWSVEGIYFARCPEGAVNTKWEQQQGKTTVTKYTVGGSQ